MKKTVLEQRIEDLEILMALLFKKKRVQGVEDIPEAVEIVKRMEERAHAAFDERQGHGSG